MRTQPSVRAPLQHCKRPECCVVVMGMHGAPHPCHARRSTNNILLATNPHDPRGFSAKLSDFGEGPVGSARLCAPWQMADGHGSGAFGGSSCTGTGCLEWGPLGGPPQRILARITWHFICIPAGLSTVLAARQTHRTSQMKGTVDFMPPGGLG